MNVKGVKQVVKILSEKALAPPIDTVMGFKVQPMLLNIRPTVWTFLVKGG